MPRQLIAAAAVAVALLLPACAPDPGPTPAPGTAGPGGLRAAVQAYAKSHDHQVVNLRMWSDGRLHIADRNTIWEYRGGSWQKLSTYGPLMDVPIFTFDITSVKAESFAAVATAFERNGTRDVEVAWVDREGDAAPAYRTGIPSKEEYFGGERRAAMTMDYARILWDIESRQGLAAAYQALRARCPAQTPRLSGDGDSIDCYGGRDFVSVQRYADPYRSVILLGPSAAGAALSLEAIDPARLHGAAHRFARDRGVPATAVHWELRQSDGGPTLALRLDSSMDTSNCRLADPCADPM